MEKCTIGLCYTVLFRFRFVKWMVLAWLGGGEGSGGREGDVSAEWLERDGWLPCLYFSPRPVYLPHSLTQPSYLWYSQGVPTAEDTQAS